MPAKPDVRGVDGAALSHVGRSGEARMVDVTSKATTDREAVARGRVLVAPSTVRLVAEGRGPKGAVIEVARFAAIMAAKRTADLIPLCHPLAITGIDVEIRPRRSAFDLEARVRTSAQTGVEMEALTAVAIGALTLYDMVKAVDKGAVIGDIRLVAKRGGKSGTWRRPANGVSRTSGR